ncbi:unnamed protein product [Prorocentrum cordatum]|uniref:Helicase ATP-binding domain-containing protein n=2 Tax=Prorocentrum cordatum TaxID=2364126 RepID=A0ABN9TBA4_9DINO|nr:unnamed protein product [Polarella glacialis]
MQALRRLVAAGTPAVGGVQLRGVPEATRQAFEGEQPRASEAELRAALQRLRGAALEAVLRPHQRAAVEWALPRRRVLIADDMGLGKTLEALAVLVALGAFPALVVCPAFARSSWAAQLERWGVARPGEYCVLRDSSSFVGHRSVPRVTILSCRMLVNQFKPLARVAWGGFVVDESHFIGTSQRLGCDSEGSVEQRLLLRLLRDAPQVTPIVLLSGTPAWTKTFDVFNQVDLLKPGALGRSRWDFARAFFTTRRGAALRPGGFEPLRIGPCERPSELNLLLSRLVMIRRRRQDVLHSLPPLDLIEVPLEIDTRDATIAVERHGIRRVGADCWDGVATAWERVGLCKAIAACSFFLERFGDNLDGIGPVVIFVRHHRVRESLERFFAENLPDAELGVLIGQGREEVLREFAAGRYQLLIAMVESCGVAVDFSRASICVFLELPDTASEFGQALARLHREGQKSTVTAYVLLGSVAPSETRPGCDDEDDARRILKECGKFDWRRWRVLLLKHQEQTRVLGDHRSQAAPGWHEQGRAEEPAAGAPAAGEGPQAPQPGEPAAELWRFAVSAETRRLHVYDAAGVHTGLASRGPALPGVEPTAADFAFVPGLAGGPRLEACGEPPAVAAVAQAAARFVGAHAGLTAHEQRLVHRGGPGGAPHPCTAESLAAVVQALHAPEKHSVRRRAAKGPGSALPAGAEWAEAIVVDRRGERPPYEQAVVLETRSTYCLECMRLLPPLGVPMVRGEAPAKRVVVRYSCDLDLFCDGACRQAFFVKRSQGVARRVIQSFERGVCRCCGLDTEQLAARLQRLASQELRGAFFDEGGRAEAAERAFFWRLAPARRIRVLSQPDKMANFWEADHVRAVADGGGEAEVGNYQTLCLACHREKTSGERRRRQAARLASKRPARPEIGATQRRSAKRRRAPSCTQAPPAEKAVCCSSPEAGGPAGFHSDDAPLRGAAPAPTVLSEPAAGSAAACSRGPRKRGRPPAGARVALAAAGGELAVAGGPASKEPRKRPGATVTPAAAGPADAVAPSAAAGAAGARSAAAAGRAAPWGGAGSSDEQEATQPAPHPAVCRLSALSAALGRALAGSARAAGGRSPPAVGASAVRLRLLAPAAEAAVGGALAGRLGGGAGGGTPEQLVVGLLAAGCCSPGGERMAAARRSTSTSVPSPCSAQALFGGRSPPMTSISQVVGLSWATTLVDRAFPSIAALASSAETCYLLEGLGGVRTLGLSVFGLGGVLGWLVGTCGTYVLLVARRSPHRRPMESRRVPADSMRADGLRRSRVRRHLRGATTSSGSSGGEIEYCLTPDGDVYPHALKCPPLHSLTGFDETGQELVVCREGQLRDGVRRMPSLYGSDWFPSIREYQDAMEFCVGPPGPSRRLVGKQALGDSAAGPTASGGLPQGSGQLPDPGANVWMCIEAPPSGGKGMPLTSEQADEWVAMGKVVMFKRGSEVLVAKQVPAGEAAEEPDARTLSVVLSHEGERRRDFAAAVCGMTETTWAFWPLRGPRTVIWCLRFIVQQDHSPKARHTRWKHECNLSITDVGVSDHELCMRLFEIGSSYDQLNLPELAIMEYVAARRAQMAEWRYRDRILGRGDGDELLEDEFLYLGTAETRGLLMVCPLLQDHVSEQLHKEMMTTKERRKLREERALTRGPGGAAGSADGRSLQQKVSNQSAEIKRLMDKLKAAGVAAAVGGWTSEALRALNSLYSGPEFEAPEGQSAAQVRRLRPELVPSELKGTYATPQLLVLAMGFSWSLYFCQEAVEARVRAAGAPRCDFVRGRHGVPELESGPKVAVYVDGVAVVSQDRHPAVYLGKKVLVSLEEGGFRCKGLEEPTSEVKFTGLVFDQKAGAIRVSRERMWRARLAFLHVCDRGWASGDELMILVGRFTWAALLRRPLMSILSSAYKFSEWAGILVLVDNLPVVLASGKGRAAPQSMNRTCRQLCALSIMGDLDIVVRWMPSELNPARLKDAIEDLALGTSGCPSHGGQGRAAGPADLERGFQGFHPGERGSDGGPPDEASCSSSSSATGDELDGLDDDPIAWGDGLGSHDTGRSMSLQVAQRGVARRAASAPLGDLEPSNLAFLQAHRVRKGTARYLTKEWEEFQQWCLERRLPVELGDPLDRAAAQYVDWLYFAGYNHERGDKLLASIGWHDPRAVRHGPRDPVRLRAALKGFRRLARGCSRTPMPEPLLFAIIGASLHFAPLEFSIGLAIAWGGALRVPVDLMSMTGRSLVPPASGSPSRCWGLLLCPEEGMGRSKVGGHDEGMLLDSAAALSIGGVLRRLKAQTADDSKVRGFSAHQFRQWFKAAAEAIGRPRLHPYQIRHGSASHDIFHRRRTLPEVQERLRHAAVASTARYHKHTRYLAELGKVSRELRDFASDVEAHFSEHVTGRRPPAAWAGALKRRRGQQGEALL